MKKSGVDALSAAQEMLQKASLVTSERFFQDRNAVKGEKDRKDEIRRQRAEQRDTLSQWYGMKRKPLSDDQKRELELLQYRNFLKADTKHIAPKRASSDASSEFVEFGFFSDVGRSKRRRLKSFADEWVEENPEFMDVIEKRIKSNIKVQKKSKLLAAKKAAQQASRERSNRESKRRKKGDAF